APIAILLSLCLPQSYCAAQEKSKNQTATPAPADFEVPASSIIDSNTNAIILSDIGSIHFIGNDKSWFSHVFTRKTRIKILNKKAFDLATVKIPLYTRDGDSEMVDKLGASTYNLENGKVVETKLDKKEIFEDREDKNHIEKKFTIPAVKEGSIIEYTYTVTSDYNFSLPVWEFQSIEYPCLWSEYEVTIPQVLFYVLVKQGIHSFAIDKAGEGHESYKVTRKPDGGGISMGAQNEDLMVSANTVKHRWVMKDIPAFHEENYLSTPRNYIDKIEFQLSKTYNGEDANDVMNNWKKANEELLNATDFGRPLREDTDWLQEYVDKATATAYSIGAMDNTKAIYYYVSSHFTCTNHYDKYIKTDLRDVIKKNSGTVGDINLLLIALLKMKGISADPVVLSTREYGFNLVKYPILERLNYVIARVSIAGKIYYLDAARPQLGFGQLANNCYNGHARIISNKDSGSVYFEADSLKEKKTTMVLISGGANGALEGTYQSTPGMQESYNAREKVSKIGEKEYFKNIQTSFGEDLDISNGAIDSLKRLEDPITVRYEFRLKQAAGSPLIYFNPMFADAWRENPFKAAERKYPVEMPYAMDNLYTFSMEIPEGYVVDELPKSAKVAFNGDQGLFEYLVGRQDNMIQLRCHMKLNKAYFPAEDYGSLRDFFGYVVKKESEQIVLKKK
ncbi:MAG TPA: DUF3857 domain-containing protein, partial [Puia sp.]